MSSKIVLEAFLYIHNEAVMRVRTVCRAACVAFFHRDGKKREALRLSVVRASDTIPSTLLNIGKDTCVRRCRGVGFTLLSNIEYRSQRGFEAAARDVCSSTVAW